MAVNYKNFNATVYTGNATDGYNGKVTYHSQHDLNRFKRLVLSKYPKWTRVNFYDKKTNECESIINAETANKI
jgi:hypothetical protein